MTTNTKVSDFITIVKAQLRTRPGFEVFTVYEDAEDRFASCVKRFTNQTDANAYEMRLIRKFAAK